MDKPKFFHKFFEKNLLEHSSIDTNTFKEWKAIADKGVGEYQFIIGECYQNGEGVEQSFPLAIHYYQLAATNRQTKAQLQLGNAYFEGALGLSKSVDHAILYYQMAANQNDSHALFMLGICYEDLNPQNAVFYYSLAVEMSDREEPAPLYRLGLCYENGKGVQQSFEKAFQFYQKAADLGFADAQCSLGVFHKWGWGVDRDLSKAIHYYQLSANQGNSKALFNLAWFYECGQEVKQSYDKAIELYQKAVDQGYADAQYHLGLLYKWGKGVDQDFSKAAYHYELAANQGMDQALFNLAWCYEKGKGVKQSYDKAVELYQKAANQGHEKAIDAFKKIQKFKEIQKKADQGEVLDQLQLGKWHEKGYQNFIEKSILKASQYYRLAADQGNAEAQYCLAICYLNGALDLRESLEDALIYCKLSADQGYEKAIDAFKKIQKFKEIQKKADQGEVLDQLQLGKLYDNRKNKVVQKSLPNACKYYKLAADQGNAEAQYLLAVCYRNGGFDFKESWEEALKYYKLAAHQGHIEAIRYLFVCYHYGQKVDESKEEALKYLWLGVKLNDPECQFQLGEYYARGWGNLNYSLVEAFKYYRLAAAQGHKKAEKSLSPRILHPTALEVDIHSYLEDHDISTLEKILKSYGSHPIFLEMFSLSWEEAQVVCEAMIENPFLTFMSPKENISPLLLAFHLSGYKEEKDLKYCWVVNPSTQQETYASVFIGNDLGRYLLDIEPEKTSEKTERLECVKKTKKVTAIKIDKRYSILPDVESKELDVDAYLQDRNLETLKKIFEASKNRFIYLRIRGANLDEITIIKDAMIANPKFLFQCTRKDVRKLYDVFEKEGYHPRLCLKCVKFGCQDLYELSFIAKIIASSGKSVHKTG